MGAIAGFDDFITDGSAVRGTPDTRGAKRSPLPDRTLRVAELTPRQMRELEQDDHLAARRQAAKAVERAEKKGQPTAEYGPTVSWLIQDERGRRERVKGRLSQLHRAFPDATEAELREQAGISGGRVPDQVIQL